MKTVIRNSYTPKTGDYCETIVVDKESEDAYIFDCDGIFTPMPQPVDVEDILRRAAEYTDETVAPLEEKLDTIEEGAQVNVIETITQNGQPLTVTDKTVNVTVPTKTSDLENDGSDGTDTYVESSTLDDYYTKSETDTQIGYETDAREIADSGLQEQIDAIVASSDVVDIVGTYAALQAYDTSKLHDNDIIKVLTDETRDDATTYYRWDADTSTWGYIGAEGPFYTKAETDAIFTPMTRTVNGKALSSDITLTAADVHALPDSTVIPTVNDATLTIQKNGTDVATFTANSASNQTANIIVPTDTSDLTNDGDGESPFATEDYVDTYGGKIDKIEVNGVEQTIVNKTVDITVPTNTSDLTNDGSDGTSTYVEADDLATVATSGDYDDLINKPTIPTVNNATLTIQKNGTDVATFTANSSTNQTANITVPTDTSDLTNGAGFITSSALSNYYTKSETYNQQEVNTLINSLSIPTKTSDLVNDSGFITLTDIPTASADDLGLIRIGTGLAIDSDGVVSVTSAGSVDWDDVTNRPTNVSYWTNDAGYITSAAIPTNVSSFTNDAGYITSADIPTNVSAFTNDAGYLTSSALSNYYTKSETYTQQEVNSLINTLPIPTKTSDLSNDGSDGTSTYVEADDLAAVATTGDYNDLLNKPTIPSYSDFTGATSSTAGAHGLVPAPAAGDESKFLQGDGTWATPADEIYTAGNGINIDANNEISVDTTVVATQTDLAGKQDTLTAGSNMDITNNVISAKVDSALSASSANPVQNSVVKAALDSKNKTIWTAYNLSPAANTPVSWKTLLGGEGIYWTWYNTANKFTNQPSQYGLLRTVIGSNDVRQDFYVQAGGGHYYRPGNGTGWYGQSGNAGAFRYLGEGVDTALSTTSSNPVRNSVVTTALNTKANSADLATVATSGSYNDLSDKPTIPTVNNGTLTIQKNGTNVQTFTANQSSNATANITVPTDTNDLTNGAGYITSSGTAAKANQLTTARTIALGTGATGTATSFDGSSNITIPVTDVKDAYVTWGGKAIYNNISPDDAGCVDEFGHNKMAFLPANCIQVHYSTDGGSTWTDYGLTDAQKIQLVTYGDVNCKSGKDTAATSSNVTNLKLRVRIAAAASTATGGSSLYTMWKKILINVTDPGSDCNMTFRYRTIANYKAGTETWVNSGTTYTVRGGSGWNSIPIPTSWPDRFGGNFTNQTSQPGQVEFVFSNTKLGTWGDKKISASAFRMIGVTNWSMPSDMARTGNIYSFDTSKNVTFPANVKVGGSLQKGNYTYTLPSKNGTVAMTSDVPTVNDATLTIQKNGSNVATFTANSATNQTANISVPNLQTSNTDPGEGAALAADTFLGVYDVAPSAIDGARITDGTITPAKTTFTTYSTTEKAVGEWIDGKTIYRKTINVGALPNNASKNTAHGISNLDTVIDCRGFAKATWGTQYPIPTVYASGDAGYNTQVSVDNTNITLSCTGNNSGKSGYVTIWYTKSS